MGFLSAFIGNHEFFRSPFSPCRCPILRLVSWRRVGDHKASSRKSAVILSKVEGPGVALRESRRAPHPHTNQKCGCPTFADSRTYRIGAPYPHPDKPTR